MIFNPSFEIVSGHALPSGSWTSANDLSTEILDLVFSTEASWEAKAI